MRTWLVLSVVGCLCGCGSSPKTQFYTLVPVPAESEVAVVPAGSPLVVGHVALPGTLDRTALVTRGPGPAVNVSDKDRWAAPLDELVRRALTGDLRGRLGAAQVLAPGDPTPPGGVRRLVVTMQHFSADSSGRVVLEADWTLAAGNPPKAGPIHHVRIIEDAGSDKGEAVATAMSRALGAVSDNVVRIARGGEARIGGQAGDRRPEG